MEIEKNQKQALESDARSILRSFATIAALALLSQCNKPQDDSIAYAYNLPPPRQIKITYSTQTFFPHIGRLPSNVNTAFVDNFKGTGGVPQTQVGLTVLFEAKNPFE